MFALSTQVLVKNYCGTEDQPVSKELDYFLSICLWSLSLISVLEALVMFTTSIKTCTKCSCDSRRLKSNVFLYLKGFKSMSPINVAVTMRLTLGRTEQGGTGIMKPCIPAYKTTCIFYTNSA